MPVSLSPQPLPDLPPPASAGLKSADPFGTPAININFLSDPKGQDRQTLLAGLKLSQKLVSTQPLAGYLAEQGEVYPGTQDEVQLDQFLRKTVHSGNALVGTCRCVCVEGGQR